MQHALPDDLLLLHDDAFERVFPTFEEEDQGLSNKVRDDRIWKWLSEMPDFSFDGDTSVVDSYHHSEIEQPQREQESSAGSCFAGILLFLWRNV